MGQKVDPNILRIGITRSWDSKWYANKRDYSKYLLKDLKIEKIIREKLEDASVSRIEIHRTSNKVIINIHSAKPGLIIGRQGAGIEALKEELEKKFHEEFSLSIKEISKPAIDARLLGENIAKQIEKRISYRRAAKMAVEKALESGAQGAKISLAGRLNGVEIARSEFFSKGKIPLHTLRANIDYAKTVAKTTYGTIGIKVWVYKGDVFKKKKEVQVTEMGQ
ncbi:MAG TPA: 30S ribosomal protein S3 [Candidatus Gracilibacteria bacterium]|nr:30S ribosomal protein S3 [Candidatus Gracilibacteria bacterium]